MKTNKGFSIIAILVYILLWLPVVLLIVFSFSSNKFGVKWEQFTIHWYLELMQNKAAINSVKASLIIAAITTVFSTIMGAFAAYGMYKYKFFGKKILRMATLLPMVLPYVVTGAALLTFFIKAIPIPLGYPSVLIAHITFSVPLAVFVMLGRMQRMDWTLELAAMDLGANRFVTLSRITGPLLLPGIMTSAALIFPWSFSDFVITYFVTGIGVTTLPIYIFSQLRYGVSPVINTVGTIFVIVAIIFLLLGKILTKEETG